MISRRTFALGVPAIAGFARRLRAEGVDGKWAGEANGPQGPMLFELELKRDGEGVTGTLSAGPMGAVEIKEGKVDGEDVSFVQVMTRGDFEVRFEYAGKVSGDEMQLTRTVQRPPGMGRGPGQGGGPGGGRPQGGQGPGGGRRPGGQGPGGGRRQGGQGGGPGGGRPTGAAGGGRGGMGRAQTITLKRVQ